MSPELPQQEVNSWIAAKALSHRLSVSSVSLGLVSVAHCLIDPCFFLTLFLFVFTYPHNSCGE